MLTKPHLSSSAMDVVADSNLHARAQRQGQFNDVSNNQALNGSTLSIGEGHPNYVSTTASVTTLCECCANNHRIMPQSFPIPLDSIPADTKDSHGISTYRRIFLAIAVFDLLCCFLLWLIYVQTTDITFGNEVFHFRFNESLFDTVIFSASRASVIEIAYGLLRSTSIWFSVMLTVLTCAFLISKIFIYHFAASNSLMTFVVILSTFLLTWFELWYTSFMMLRNERREKLFNARCSLVDGLAPTNGTVMPTFYAPAYGTFLPAAPLAVSTVGTARPNDLLLPIPAASVISGDFYSPRTSLSGSDDESDEVESVAPAVTNTPVDSATQLRHNAFKQAASETVDTVWDLFTSDPSLWRIESGENPSRGIVRSRVVVVDGSKRKYFRIDAILRGFNWSTAQLVREELFGNGENVASWYNAVRYAKRIDTVDDHTDVMYTISADFAGGLIAAREYLSLRHYCERDLKLRDAIRYVPGQAELPANETVVRVFSVCNAPVEHSLVPVCKQYIRAEQGPAGMLFAQLPRVSNGQQQQDDGILFGWLFYVNLKGWIPQSVLDKTTARVLFDFIEQFSNRVRSLGGAS